MIRQSHTSDVPKINSTHSVNSLPVVKGSIVSARATSLFPWPSKHLTLQFPLISAYPLRASLSVDRITGAAGCEGCVEGKGKVRRNETTGVNVGIKDAGNDIIIIPDPGLGVVPDEPSATTLV